MKRVEPTIPARVITLWGKDDDDILRSIYPDMANKEITRLTGWSKDVLKYRSKQLGLKKTKACKANTPNATVWTIEMEQFLKDNFFLLTNAELASALNLTLTVTRNKARALGLCRVEVDPWNEQQINYLLENYKLLGDVEIAENLQKLFPRKKNWTKGNVNKKRQLMQLHRTKEEIFNIVSRHMLPGGRSYTIIRNSSSINLHDGYVASLIAWRDKDLQKEIMKYPELIELKRAEILLSRAIKGAKHA